MLKRMVSLALAILLLVTCLPVGQVRAEDIPYFYWPVDISIALSCGFNGYDGHKGMDFSCVKGTPVYAAAAGTVKILDYGCTGSHYISAEEYKCKYGTSCAAYCATNIGSYGGWANHIVIDHGNGYYTRYAHMMSGSWTVNNGDWVEAGTLIGYTSNTGYTTGKTGYHLHFEVFTYADGKMVRHDAYGKGWLHKEKPSVSNSAADLGTDFYAPILNKEHWKIIENSDGVVQTANETGTANQLWWFERQSDGSYYIRSCVDGTFLDVYGAYTDMGTTVQTCWETGSPAQRWFIYEDGDGYVLRTALNDYVLDLPNNDPTNGNTLQIWERNGTGAQRWAIYRGEECKLTAPILSVNVGDSASSTKFTWNEVYGERCYDVKIWKDTLWEGDAYHVKWGASSGYEVVLPAGLYHAYVDAGHEFEGYMSNVVTFSVQDPPAISTSESDIKLTLGETDWQTIEITMDGYYDSAYTYSASKNNDNISWEWGTLVNGAAPITIIGVKPGEAVLTIDLIDKETEYILDSCSIHVVVECAHEDKLCISAKEADCVNPGNNQYYVCNICNEVLKADGKTKTTVDDEIIEATGHSYASVVTDPACTEQGYTTYTCDTCTDSYIDSYVDALGHSFTNYIPDGNAACTADGTKTAKCDRCDATETVTDVGSKIGHSMGDWYEIKAPACTEKGAEQSDCANCGHYETREVNAKGHSYDYAVTTPTCTEQGYTTHSCEVCGDSYIDSYVDALGHSYTSAVTAPTCTEQGYTTHTCVNCNVSYTDSYIEATGHSYSYTVSKEPTQNADGVLTGKCSTCEDTTTLTLPKLSTADYTYKVTKEPSYTEDGVGSYTWNTDAYGKIIITVSIPKLTAPETDAKITVSSQTAIVGQQVEVTISLENNPGIASMQLTIGYDADVMTLVGVTDAGKLGDAVHSDNLSACPYTLTWANDLATENYTYNGEIVTLVFRVAEDAQPGDYAVTVRYDYDNFDIFNVDGEEVLFAAVNGSVRVTDVLLGDVNSDGKVNTQDRMILTRYLAKWTGYAEDTINLTAADVNCDGKVNTLDRMVLTRYLAKWTGYEELGG